MFKVGDLVLYGSTGVCRVTDITTRNLVEIDKDQLFYVLTPLYQDCVISIPVDATSIPIRAIISKEEADQIIQQIPKIKTEVFHSSVLRELNEHYNSYLSTYDCVHLVELCMSVYAKKQQFEEEGRKTGTIDEKFLKLAEELLFGELAVVYGIEKDEVPALISEKLNEDWRTSSNA